MTAIPAIDYDRKLIARDELPLYEKHILFTSPRNYATVLAPLLIYRGARPVWMPTIEIWPVPDYARFDNAIRHMASYDWIAFTSENGAEAFCNRLSALGMGPEAVKGTKLAGFPSDAKVLKRYGLDTDVVPGVMTPHAIIDGIMQSARPVGRVLVPCPHVVGVPEPYVVPEFIEELKNRGMVPERVEVYRTMALRESGSLERAMIQHGDIDIIVFTSSAEIFSFLDQVGDEREAVNRCTIAYMGSYTARTGQEMGLRVDVVPQLFTMRGLVEALEAHCAEAGSCS